MAEVNQVEESKRLSQDCVIPNLKLKYYNAPTEDGQGASYQGRSCNGGNPELCLCHTQVVIKDDIFGQQQVTIGYANIVHDGICDRNLFHLQIANQSLQYLPSVLINSRVTSLNISCNAINSLSDLCAPNLLMLNASNNKLKVFSDIVNTPIALRCIDVSYNQITEIYNLEKLWALSELNLSYNNLDRIDAIEGLDNLIMLNLSHNKLTKVKRISCKSLRFLLMNNNMLRKVPDFQGSPKLRMLSLEHNKLEDLTPLEFAYNVNELHLEGNNIEDINQLRHLKPLMTLYHLWVQPNPLTNVSMFRNIIIFMLPTLLTLDGVRLKSVEKVESRNIFNPSLQELSFRDRIECILDQASQNGNVQLDNFLFQRPLPPILLLVGEPMGRSFKISASLKVRLRDQVHLGGVHSTVTTLEYPDSIHAQDIPVSFEIFEDMKSRGEFIAKSHILGRACGFSSSQILRASEKCCLLVASVPLGIALSLKNSGITAKTVLILPPSQEQLYAPSPASSKETLAALVACETRQDFEYCRTEEEDFLEEGLEYGADGQQAVLPGSDSSTFHKETSGESQMLTNAVSFDVGATEVLEFNHLEGSKQKEYSDEQRRKQRKCEDPEEEQPKNAKTLLFPPTEMISLTLQCRKSVSGVISTHSTANALKISLNNPDPACEAHNPLGSQGPEAETISSIFKKEKTLDIPTPSVVAGPSGVTGEGVSNEVEVEEEEEEDLDSDKSAKSIKSQNNKLSFFTNLSLCVYTPSGHHQCCMNLKPYDATEKYSMNHGIFFFPEGRRHASKKSNSNVLSYAETVQQDVETQDSVQALQVDSNHPVAPEVDSKASQLLNLQDTSAEIERDPSGASSKRTSFRSDTEFHDEAPQPSQLLLPIEEEPEEPEETTFDGSVLHPKLHSHQILQNIVKLRQEYIQFHQDNPGFFHAVLSHANTEMCVLDCLDIAQTLLDEAASDCQSNDKNYLDATKLDQGLSYDQVEGEDFRHIESGLAQIKAVMNGRATCF